MAALMASGLALPQINTMDEFSKGVSGSQTAQVNSMNIDNAKQQQYMQGLNTIAAGSAYAMDPKTGQVDPTKWNEVVDSVAKSGADVAAFRDKPQLAPMLLKLSLTTQQQISNAQTQQQIDMAIQKYGLEVQQYLHPLPVKTSPGDTFNDPRTGAPVAGSGPQSGFYGSSTDQQALQILAKGDPNSYEYAQAYNVMSQPAITYVPDGKGGQVQVVTPRTLPQGTRPPTYKGQIPIAAPNSNGPPVNPDVAPIGSMAPPPGSPSAAGNPFGVTNAPIPPVNQPTGTPNTMGNGTTITPVPGIKQTPTETQLRYHTITSLIDGEIPTIQKNFKDLTDPWSQTIGGIGSAVGMPDVARALQSPGYKQAFDSVTTVIQDALYALSGSSSNPGEVIKQGMVLMPHFGDDAQTQQNSFERIGRYIQSIADGTNDPDLIAKTKELTSTLNFNPTGSSGDKGGTASPDNPPIKSWTEYGFGQ